MSYMLPHLDSGYAVDQAILSEEDRVVIIRFGHDWDPVSIFIAYGIEIQIVLSCVWLHAGLHEDGRNAFPHSGQNEKLCSHVCYFH